jgi:hypothetical protein
MPFTGNGALLVITVLFQVLVGLIQTTRNVQENDQGFT